MSWSLTGHVACSRGVGLLPVRLVQGWRPTRQRGTGRIGEAAAPLERRPTQLTAMQKAFWGRCQVQGCMWDQGREPRCHARPDRSAPASHGSILVDGGIVLQVGGRVALIPQAGAQPKGQRRAVRPTLQADEALPWCLLGHQATKALHL